MDIKKRIAEIKIIQMGYSMETRNKIYSNNFILNDQLPLTTAENIILYMAFYYLNIGIF